MLRIPIRGNDEMMSGAAASDLLREAGVDSRELFRDTFHFLRVGKGAKGCFVCLEPIPKVGDGGGRWRGAK